MLTRCPRSVLKKEDYLQLTAEQRQLVCMARRQIVTGIEQYWNEKSVRHRNAVADCGTRRMHEHGVIVMPAHWGSTPPDPYVLSSANLIRASTDLFKLLNSDHDESIPKNMQSEILHMARRAWRIGQRLRLSPARPIDQIAPAEKYL